MALTWGTVLPSCLTQNVQYEPPRNYPPSIESAPQSSFPLNSVIVLPDDLQGDGDGGPSGVLNFLLTVRDPNLDERLRYAVYIDYNPALPPGAATGGVLVPAGAMAADRLTRELPFSLPFAGLLAQPGACHRIELLVVGEDGFQDPPRSREPRLPGDMATATWWVATRPIEGGAVDMTECP